MEKIQDMIIPITEYTLMVDGKEVTVKLEKPVCMSEILRKLGYLKKKKGESHES